MVRNLGTVSVNDKNNFEKKSLAKMAMIIWISVNLGKEEEN